MRHVKYRQHYDLSSFAAYISLVPCRLFVAWNHELGVSEKCTVKKRHLSIKRSLSFSLFTRFSELAGGRVFVAGGRVCVSDSSSSLLPFSLLTHPYQRGRSETREDDKGTSTFSCLSCPFAPAGRGASDLACAFTSPPHYDTVLRGQPITSQ